MKWRGGLTSLDKIMIYTKSFDFSTQRINVYDPVPAGSRNSVYLLMDRVTYKHTKPLTTMPLLAIKQDNIGFYFKVLGEGWEKDGESFTYMTINDTRTAIRRLKKKIRRYLRDNEI